MKKFIPLFIVLITACQPAKDASHTFIKIHQEVPNLIHIDFDMEGASHGDLLAFDADVTTDANHKGKLSGYLLTTFISEGDHDAFQERMVQMVFNLGNDNNLVVGGNSVYPNVDKSEMVENQPQVRAIIGGTGSYIGAKGQITTTRNSDGSYEHIIELVE